MHHSEQVSSWVQRWTHLVPVHGTVLDVACGHGRHLRWFASRGHAVVGVDRDPAAAQAASGTALVVQADIENGPWPFAGQRFDAVIVTNYLWRALLPTLVESVANGGVLIYETFAAGNETVGKPSRPDFLLQPGELLQACTSLQVIAYENGFLEAPDRFVQRIVAVRKRPADGALPERHRLQPAG